MSMTAPFGIALYPRFAFVYEMWTGQSVSDFAYVPGKTMFSTWTEVVTTCIVYFVVIFGGQWLMKGAAPWKLQRLFQCHNILLTAVSAALLLLIAEQIIPVVSAHGFFYAFCSEQAWTPKLELLYYLNYLVKYWELLDTVFLVAKKKNLEFLHYYHHSMTMVLCYTLLDGKTAVCWVPIVLNLMVHVLMYYYYYRAAAGAKLWWKKYLTTMQITQFIIDLGVIYYCAYNYVVAQHGAHFLPYTGSCSATNSSAIFGCTILSSYLVLFISFYRKTYTPKTKTC